MSCSCNLEQCKPVKYSKNAVGSFKNTMYRKSEKIKSIKSLLGLHDGSHNLSFVVYDDDEKIMVEMDSEKQKVDISPSLLNLLEHNNIFYKLN